LNIDFASEVRLEKKLGEGGFGQVRALEKSGHMCHAVLEPLLSLQKVSQSRRLPSENSKF
jgi:hypothetical protein